MVCFGDRQPTPERTGIGSIPMKLHHPVEELAHGRRLLGEVLRQVLPGHPEARALGGGDKEAARVEAQGRPEDRDQADPRLSPGAQGLQPRLRSHGGATCADTLPI